MYRREIELKNNPELAAAELARSEMHAHHSPPLTHGESLAVDSGATDLESATGPGSLSSGFVGHETDDRVGSFTYSVCVRVCMSMYQLIFDNSI